MRILKICILTISIFITLSSSAIGTSYYVREHGNDANDGLTYEKAKATLNSVISTYTLSGGDIIYLDGTITHSSTPIFTSADTGSKIHPTTGYTDTITSLSGSIATFTNMPTGVNTTTDYLCIYNSFKGNAGFFKVSGVNDKQITVDTSDLPGGTFVTENSSPWTLIGAIIRPIRITAYNQSSEPTIQNSNDGIKYNNSPYHLMDHVQIYNNSRYSVFVDGGSHFCLFDHITASHTDYNIWTIRYEDVSADVHYMILQHSDLSDSGNLDSSPMGAVIYAGKGEGHDYHNNYQIYAYNYIHLDVGGSSHSNQLGTGYNGKGNADYVIIWGNHFYGWNAKYKQGYGAIKLGYGPTVVANNYIEDWGGGGSMGGIVFMNGFATTEDQYIFNNILDGVGGDSSRGGIYVEGGNHSNARVYNNVIYNIQGTMAAAKVHGYGAPGRLGYFYNNIIHTAEYGLWGRSVASGVPGYIDNHGNNFVYNCTYPFYETASQNSNEWTADPGLINPANKDFRISDTSSAKDAGTDLSSYFSVDNHNATDPGINSMDQPFERFDTWDIGAYEYVSDDPPGPPAPPTGLVINK